MLTSSAGIAALGIVLIAAQGPGAIAVLLVAVAVTLTALLAAAVQASGP